MIENITEVICCLLSFSLVFPTPSGQRHSRGLNLPKLPENTIEKITSDLLKNGGPLDLARPHG
jgi:hypothetical protein